MNSCQNGPDSNEGIQPISLADVLRFGLVESPQKHEFHQHVWRAFNAIMLCRTPALGGHHYRCSNCAKDHSTPHSCRNRHCPTCQGGQAYEWLKKQEESLLPIPYFHIIFTLPHGLNELIAHNQASLYKLLFDCANQTLLEFGRNRWNAQIGVTSILHTWGQTLYPHYHLHCIVTGGGLSFDGMSWKATKPYFCFPVKALSKVFRAKYLNGLQQLWDKGILHCNLDLPKLLKKMVRRKWVVYAKRPFAGPQQVLSYLSLYTHRVAISNGRIIALNKDDATVTFAYKDYADKSRKKTMTLKVVEFLRRLSYHVIPKRFVKIRHYGILSHRNRKEKITIARELLANDNSRKLVSANEPAAVAHQENEPTIPSCPYCGQHTLVLIAITRANSIRTFKPP
jgi:DNA-directed RNA polymerase subunit RPC12/RpoP